MKNKITTWTQQDELENVANRIKGFAQNCITNPGSTWHRGKRKQYVEITKALKALPRPLVLASVQRVLKEGGMDVPWWQRNDYLPVCDFCEKTQPWILIIDGALYCNDPDDDNKVDAHICPLCVAHLGTEVLKNERTNAQ
jgi:hypothetical protein